MNSETCSSVRESACCRSYRQLVVPRRWMQPDCPSAAGLPLNRIASFEWTDHVADLAWVFASGGDVRPLSCCGSAQKVENNGLGGVAGAGLWCLNDETDRRRNLEISRRGMRGASSREGPGSQLVLGTRVEPLGLKSRQAVNLLSCAGTHGASLPLSASRAAKREPGISLAPPPAPSGFAQLPSSCSWLAVSCNWPLCLRHPPRTWCPQRDGSSSQLAHCDNSLRCDAAPSRPSATHRIRPNLSIISSGAD